MRRRSLLAQCAAFAAAAPWLLAPVAHAAAYPERPVKIIVPFSAGAAADAVARPLAAKLAEYWGRQVIVENKPGLTPGPQVAAHASPDGYTLLLGAASTMVTTPLTVSNLPYDPQRDFVPITRLATLPPVLAVNASLGVKSLAEFIALLKSKPGQLNYASSGNGAPNHLGMELLLDMTGTNMVHVPYKGAAPAVVDMVGNQVQAGFAALPSVLSQIKSGRLVALAVGTRERSPVLPQVPAVGETVPGFEYTAWYGLFAPAGTPAAVVEKIRADTARALTAPELVRAMRAEGAVPSPSSGAEMARTMDEETVQWRRIIKERKIHVD